MTKVVEISDETYEHLKDQLLADGGKEVNTYEDLVGGKYFFRTVTYFLTGEVKKVVGRFVYLKNAAASVNTQKRPYMNTSKPAIEK